MRILFLSNLEFEGFAGPTYCVPALIGALSELEEVVWYNMRPVEREEWRGLPFYRNPNDFAFDIEDFTSRIWRPDLIVFEGFYAFHPNATLLGVLSSGIPYVIEPHCALTSGDQGKKTFKKRICNAVFYNRFAQGAAAIHYLTEKERDESGEKWNRNSFIEPNGIEVPKERPHRESWHGDVPEIVFVGRVEPYQKGLDVLLESLTPLNARADLPRFHLSIYGNSVNGFSNEMEKKLQAAGLSDVVAIRGPVYGDAKDAVLRAADIFLLTSRYEGMPMGLLEACAYGLPCVVTPGTNMSDVILAEGAGWVCDLSPESVREAIVVAASSAEAYAEMALASRRVAELFSWPSIAKSIRTDYLKVIGHA